MITKSNWSSTWRSVGVGLREVVQQGRSWVVGDGKKILFWKDKWLSGETLLESVNGTPPEDYDRLRAADLWTHGSGWQLHRISPYVSENKRLELATVVLDTVTRARDRLSWGEQSDGKFSVSSAYDLLTRDESHHPNMESFFRKIWRVVVPERVRVFLWLIGNQAVMTNEKRLRRHLCDSDICQVCKGGIESIIHILRDCLAMMGIWARIVHRQKRQGFFTKSLLEWVYDNLCERLIVAEVPWRTMFAVAIWWGWKWRCGNVFGEIRKCRDRLRFIMETSKEVVTANHSIDSQVPRRERVERLIGWSYPPDGWVKLNTGGASRGNRGLATAGGVLRDENGEW